ncbi:MAG TPA: DNA polymerase IV [Firmicutes bacterium]|jgi:DNA polymerase-4|nr:DNA polymerase IV [Bacillota bacterium]
MRTIMHVDMDAFFAAVEVLDNPEYAGKPLIIGGYKDSPRGVVSTASYEARKFGVRSAMPLRQAALLCPQGIFIPGRMHRYQEVSHQVHSIFPEFSPVVEPLSIDEAFLDMTGCEHFYSSLEEMGTCLKQRIREETGLTASVGIAPNKFLAKLASDWRKPDGLFVLRPHEVEGFLRDLPVSKLWGVGKKSEEVLHKHGLYYVRDILPHSLTWLQERLGAAMGAQVFNLARGLDDRPVEPWTDVQSVSNEITFPEDQDSFDFLRQQLAKMSEKVGWRLRRQGLYARTVSIKVRFGDFRTITRSHTLEHSFNDDDTIFQEALHLLQQVKLKPVRLLGVGVSNLSEGAQLSLFDAGSGGSASKLTEVMDAINRKYSHGTITRGRTLPQSDTPEH